MQRSLNVSNRQVINLKREEGIKVTTTPLSSVRSAPWKKEKRIRQICLRNTTKLKIDQQTSMNLRYADVYFPSDSGIANIN